MSRREVFSTHSAAKICRVTPMTVIRWIEEGRIEAFRTAGGHRRIRRAELERFCEGAGIPFDEAPLDAKPHALVVTADPALQERFVALMGQDKRDWQCHGASTGFETGHVVAERHPRLVLVDMRTPGLAPMNILARLQADESRHRPVTILLCEESTLPSEAALQAAGSPAVLPLDFGGSDLQPLVDLSMRDPKRRRRRTTEIPAQQPEVKRMPGVLVVDGRTRELGGLSNDISQQTPHVDYVTSLHEGLLRAGRTSPEVLVLNGSLPEDEMVDLCSDLRRYMPVSSTRLVVVFQQPRPGLATRLRETGVAECVTAPVPGEELTRLLG